MIFISVVGAEAQTDQLPSWNDGAAKNAIIQFVQATTDKSSPNFVAPEDRLATFDQDGTTWVEHPIYTQVMFAFNRVMEMAPKRPEWKTKRPFKSLISGDQAAIEKFTSKDLEQIFFATHTGMRYRHVPGDSQGMDRKGKGSAVEKTLHRFDLPADAGGHALSSRQRL